MVDDRNTRRSPTSHRPTTVCSGAHPHAIARWYRSIPWTSWDKNAALANAIAQRVWTGI
jgi:hypothetical protein